MEVVYFHDLEDVDLCILGILELTSRRPNFTQGYQQIGKCDPLKPKVN